MEQATVFRLLANLGVTVTDLNRLRTTPYPDSVRLLDDLKERVRQNWKRLAFELHPDRTGGDPAKTELFKRLAQVRADFDKLTVSPAPPSPPPTYISVPHVQQPRPSYAASPFTKPGRPVNPWRVVTMKP